MAVELSHPTEGHPLNPIIPVRRRRLGSETSWEIFFTMPSCSWWLR
jgi:hypothetical protein